jgi:lysylphosphatidylglycerol synthetase-like protein (DUF2156 family)
MNKQRLFLIIVGIIGLVSVFLPLFKTEIAGHILIMRGVDFSIGRRCIVAFAVIIVSCFLFERKRLIKGNLHSYFVTLSGFFVTFNGIRLLLTLQGDIEKVIVERYGDSVRAAGLEILARNISWEIGIYLLILAGAMTVVLSVLSRKFAEV